jgi:hypothetical protein
MYYNAGVGSCRIGSRYFWPEQSFSEILAWLSDCDIGWTQVHRSIAFISPRERKHTSRLAQIDDDKNRKTKTKKLGRKNRAPAKQVEPRTWSNRDLLADHWSIKKLPDGIIEYQKYQFWFILEGLGTEEKLCIPCEYLVYLVVIGYTYVWSFGIFCGHLVYFVVIWCIFPLWHVLPKNLATQKIWQHWIKLIERA